MYICMWACVDREHWLESVSENTRLYLVSKQVHPVYIGGPTKTQYLAENQPRELYKTRVKGITEELFSGGQFLSW